MNLTCPGCGLEAGAEAWQSDGEAREAMTALAALPAEVQVEALRYLALFRPAKSRLSWSRARKVLTELCELTVSGVVTQARQERPCLPAVWGAAMAQMQARRESIKRPLSGHGYLSAVAFELAGQMVAYPEPARSTPIVPTAPASKTMQGVSALEDFARGKSR